MQAMPNAGPEEAYRKTCAHGSEIALRSRTVAVDPRVHMEMRAERLVDGEVVATEELTRHLAKTPCGLAQRTAQRLLAVTLGILLNTLNGRPARALADYDGR